MCRVVSGGFFCNRALGMLRYILRCLLESIDNTDICACMSLLYGDCINLYMIYTHAYICSCSCARIIACQEVYPEIDQ